MLVKRELSRKRNIRLAVKLQYRNIKDGEICFTRQKTERTTSTLKEIRATVTLEKNAIMLTNFDNNQ